MKFTKKIISCFLFAIIIGFASSNLVACKIKSSDDTLSVVATNFPAYDFARAVIGDENISLSMLLKPGSETHNYEPTPKDIKKIKNSELFIYVGGESDEWIEGIMSEIDTSKTKIVKMMDCVNLYEEEITEGMQIEEDEKTDETEYDEHVWTSPKNAIKIISSISENIQKIDPENKEKYIQNASSYIAKLNDIDSKITDIVENAETKTVIFGDRFPLMYFTKDYGLTPYGAFPGCSDQTEANPKTIASLIDKVVETKAKAVFKIELSSGNIARTIVEGAKERGFTTEVKTFNAVHNVSQSDFDAGKTYVDFMNENVETLKIVLGTKVVSDE